MDRLDEIKMRLAAVPKRWMPMDLEDEVWSGPSDDSPITVVPYRIPDVCNFVEELSMVEETTPEQDFATARLIANAPIDLEWAVEEIERLREADAFARVARDRR